MSSNNNLTYPITVSRKIHLSLHQGILEYIAGMKSGEVWNVRGLKSTSSEELDRVKQRRKEEIRKKLESGELDPDNHEFVQEVCSEFGRLMKDKKRPVPDLRSLLPGRAKIYFVIGSPRTGGTYMYSQIAEAIDWPWQSLLYVMTHDSLPYRNYLSDHPSENSSIGWRTPQRYYNLIFQLCQFLLYGSREAPDANHFALKNMGLIYCMNLLDELFRDRAVYIMTVRHPAGVAASRAEIWDRPNDDFWKRQCLKMWYRIYRAGIKDGIPEGELVLLPFGKEMEQWLDEFYQSRAQDHSPDSFSPRDRSLEDPFWDQDLVTERIETVKQAYRIEGLEFPLSP